MKLIIGLWNPWEKYRLTRHNVGFLFLDYYKEKNNFSDFILESKFKAEISTGLYEWEKCILVKPQTFMNLSWESVQKIAHYYKIELNDWIVVYDDISLEFWKIRFRDKWSAWGQNWIKDIISKFWWEFNRIKIWVGQDRRYDLSDWVLSKFPEEEQIDLDNEVFPESMKLLHEKF